MNTETQTPNLSGLKVGDEISFMIGEEVMAGNYSPNHAKVEYVFPAVPYCTIVDIREENGIETRIDFHEKPDQSIKPDSNTVQTFARVDIHKGRKHSKMDQVIHIWPQP